MKAPHFWSEKTLLSDILCPIGFLYGLATAVRFLFVKPYQASCPVICVGNVTAGGTGKTPVSLALAELLTKKGHRPFFLTRGYGGRLKGVRVDPQIHTAGDVGDEPLLLVRRAPVVVNPDRGAGAELACRSGADCLIMDDGFQNPSLKKDVSFLVFDGPSGMGNGRTIPAGPLRENLDQALLRAQALIILGEDRYKIADRTTLPVFYADVEPIRPQHTDRSVLAFAGIGRPEKLYHSLESCGLKVARTRNFPDHHVYDRRELEDLIAQAHRENLDLYTTSKDFVKIPADLQSAVHVLEIGISWRDSKALENFLEHFHL